MLRLLTPSRARFAAVCWGVGALSCTDLAPPDHLTANVGGQSGDGSGIHGGQTGDGAGIAKIGVVQCPHKSTVWKGDLDETVPELDLAPEDVLENVENSVEETLGWLVNERLSLTPGHTEVTVDLHYDGGEIRLREPDVDDETVRQEAADIAPPTSYVSIASRYCGAVLELELEATLRTADGALDETFPVVVSANQRDAAHFEGWLPEKLDGSLASRTTKANSRLYVASMVGPWGSSGEIMIIPFGKTADDEPGTAERIASWPVLEPAVCVDTAYGTFFTSNAPTTGTLRELFERSAPRGDVPIQWRKTPHWPDACSTETLESSDCNTTLHVGTSSRSDEWCLSVSPFEPMFTAVASVDVDLTTADEQWRGTYLTTATLDVAQDGATSVSLSLFEQRTVPSGNTLGFPNLQLVSDSEASLNFALYAGPMGTSGSMIVVGQTPTLEDSDAGVPEGATTEVVIEAAIGNATN